MWHRRWPQNIDKKHASSPKHHKKQVIDSRGYMEAEHGHLLSERRGAESPRLKALEL